jgi:hypothetical protein
MEEAAVREKARREGCCCFFSASAPPKPLRAAAPHEEGAAAFPTISPPFPPPPLFQVATGSSRSIAAATVDLAFSGEVKGAAASPPPPSLSFLSRSSDASTSALVSKLCPSGET